MKFPSEWNGEYLLKEMPPPQPKIGDIYSDHLTYWQVVYVNPYKSKGTTYSTKLKQLGFDYFLRHAAAWMMLASEQDDKDLMEDCVRYAKQYLEIVEDRIDWDMLRWIAPRNHFEKDFERCLSKIEKPGPFNGK